MTNKWRRFEVFLPLQRNDGSDIEEEDLGRAVLEVRDQVHGVRFENPNSVGRWVYEGMEYRDNLARLIVEVRDTLANRTWMRAFKARWKKRLDQLELWMV